MKRLTRMELINFQSHAHTVIDFENGFNAILGQSDQGKTAIFRALNWALYNKPNGKEFIRKGTTTCTVAVWFNDGTMITRCKGVKENYYEIVYNDGREERLEGFGVSAPTEVLMAHGMREVNLGLSKRESLNLAHQLDGPFLLKDSPQQRAVAIGRMAHTEVVDKSLKNIASDVRATKQQIKDLNSDINKIEEDLRSYAQLDIIKATIEEAEAIINEIDAKTAIVQNVKSIVRKTEFELQRKVGLEAMVNINEVYVEIYETVESLLEQFKIYGNIKALATKIEGEFERLVACEGIIKSYEDIDNIISMINSIEEEMNNYKCISNKINSIENLQTQAQNLKTLIKGYEQTINADTIIDECQQKLIEYTKIKSINDKLEEQKARKVKGVKITEDIKANLEETIKQYQSAIRELGKCPMCFSEVDDRAMENISKNLF